MIRVDVVQEKRAELPLDSSTAASGAVCGWSLSENFSEFGAVDHEAVLHVSARGSIERGVDLLRGDHFNVARDAVLAAVLEHLLRLRNAADERTDDLATAEEQGERVELHAFRRCADHHQ